MWSVLLREKGVLRIPLRGDILWNLRLTSINFPSSNILLVWSMHNGLSPSHSQSSFILCVFFVTGMWCKMWQRWMWNQAAHLLTRKLRKGSECLWKSSSTARAVAGWREQPDLRHFSQFVYVTQIPQPGPGPTQMTANFSLSRRAAAQLAVQDGRRLKRKAQGWKCFWKTKEMCSYFRSLSLSL